MNAFEEYKALQKAWLVLCSQEPQAWSRERAQYIGLLQEGQVEEFFTLICDNLPMFSSIFTLEDGFLIFEKDCPLRLERLRGFCAHLALVGNYSDRLKFFWLEGLFDRLVFRVFADVVDCSGAEQEVLVNSSLRSVFVSGASFVMGALEGDTDSYREERPRHKQHLGHSMFMCRYTCTQALYAHIMHLTPSCFHGAARPVEEVSWGDAVVFCNKLSLAHGLEPVYTIPPDLEDALRAQSEDWDQRVIRLASLVQYKQDANGYRLPNEAEWEYCAKAGTEYLYSGGDNMDEVGWYDSNSNETTQAVGQKKSNPFGLHDMSGNVWEWVWDRYRLYGEEPDEWERVARGGCWDYVSVDTRASTRFSISPDIRMNNLGFRLVRTAP